ncbi:MAG: hypothetical protein WBK20_00090 [Spirochaetota bacterium]
MNATVFIPLSQLKQLRRQFYNMLYNDYIQHSESIHQQRKSNIIDHIEIIKKNNTTIKPNNTTYTWQHFEKLQTTHANNTFIELPVFVPEDTLDDTIKKIETYMHNGFKHFIIPTYGWLEFFKGKDVVLCAGDFCYCVNSFTYEVYNNNAVSYFTISGDMDSLDVTTRYYNGFIQFHKPKIYLVTRLHIPDAVYTFKHKQYCLQHYAHYDILINCQ